MTILYILGALLIFGAFVLIHELGHFITARIFGVAIEEFAIGMGPKLISKRSEKTGIVYSLRLFPIGGFVQMVGEDGETDNENAFQKKKPWQRLIILAAGATMNILLGIILMFTLVATTEGPLGTTVIHSFVSEEGQTASSEESGLMAKDEILKVGKNYVHTADELLYEIMHKGYEPIDVLVMREGEKLLISDVVFPTEEQSGVLFGTNDFMVYGTEKTALKVLEHSFYRSVLTARMVWDSLIDLATGRYGMEAVSGPIGVTEVIVDTAQSQSFSNLLYLAAVISVNLGIMNLLPLPALDGGRILFVIIEILSFGRPVNRKIEGYIHGAGMAILLLFMLLITFKDVGNLFERLLS